MTAPTRVRVLLVGPDETVLLIKYRNTGRDGVERRCWTTPGGGRDPDETVEACARREIAEETGLTDITLGPIVWYGEDSRRAGDWNITFREHFILAWTTTSTLSQSGWTDHERSQILEMRWWSVDELRTTAEVIYPPGLANGLTPLLAGRIPEQILELEPI